MVGSADGWSVVVVRGDWGSVKEREKVEEREREREREGGRRRRRRVVDVGSGLSKREEGKRRRGEQKGILITL